MSRVEEIIRARLEAIKWVGDAETFYGQLNRQMAVENEMEFLQKLLKLVLAEQGE